MFSDRIAHFCVNADWPCFRAPGSVVTYLELRLRTGAHRSVRTRSVTFADDSLTMITATPLTPRSTQPEFLPVDLRYNRLTNGADGAGWSSTLSSLLSSARRRANAPGATDVPRD